MATWQLVTNLGLEPIIRDDVNNKSYNVVVEAPFNTQVLDPFTPIKNYGLALYSLGSSDVGFDKKTVFLTHGWRGPGNTSHFKPLSSIDGLYDGDKRTALIV